MTADDPLKGLWDEITRGGFGTSVNNPILTAGVRGRPIATPGRQIPFIGDPSGSGKNVAPDYMAGGKFSSQRSVGDTRTVIPPTGGTASTTPNLSGAWSNVAPSTTRSSSFAGMPANLAAAASRNLAREDQQISRFNLAARGATGPAVPVVQGGEPRTSTAGAWNRLGMQGVGRPAYDQRDALYRGVGSSYQREQKKIAWASAQRPRRDEDED